MGKANVIGELLTTVEVSLDTIATVLEGNIGKNEVLRYKQKMVSLGRTIDKLTGIIEGNTSYGVLEPQMDSIKNKYSLLTSIVG